MPWFKVDDSFGDHPKVRRIPRRQRAAAIGLWTLAGSWAARYLTDGEIPDYMVEEFGGSRRDADALVKVGLWEKTEDGYQFHDWTAWQYPERRKIPRVVRAAVYARDGFACLRCGSVDDLSIDHIFPWSLGGSDEPDNLQTLCLRCNRAKSDRIEDGD